LDESAEKIGAVNTVNIENGKLYGYNTDAHGFIKPLKNAYGDLQGAKVAVFGAGGAARACIYALKSEGAKVTIFARDTEKAKSLAEEFQVDLQELTTHNSQLTTHNIVVNATPLGTKGKLEQETPATAEQLKNIQLAYDLVYNPFETRFLREAKEANVPTIGGMAMLIAQAIEQQKIWTGLDAPIKQMSQAALQKLNQKN
jgi:shikimate dehydrogenase